MRLNRIRGIRGGAGGREGGKQVEGGGGISKRKYKVNIEIAIPQLQQRQRWRVFGPLLIVPVGAGGDESSGRGHVRICPLRRPCKPLSNHRRASRHSPADARTGTPTRPVCRRRARIRDRPGNTFVGCCCFFFVFLFCFYFAFSDSDVV